VRRSRAALGQAANGTVDVAEDHARLEVMLPRPLAQIADKIQRAIQSQGKTMLVVQGRYANNSVKSGSDGVEIKSTVKKGGAVDRRAAPRPARDGTASCAACPPHKVLHDRAGPVADARQLPALGIDAQDPSDARQHTEPAIDGIEPQPGNVYDSLAGLGVDLLSAVRLPLGCSQVGNRPRQTRPVHPL
jgi:hypothetical protein